MPDEDDELDDDDEGPDEWEECSHCGTLLEGEEHQADCPFIDDEDDFDDEDEFDEDDEDDGDDDPTI
jgi:hypothetical protein